ncbi:MAG TPA: ABC transporter permease [Candidatus Hydrogenedentes bacterium]|nr:ABC transporter permease [Candidatus Hydrogenedentota bacterium]HRT18487.1 ABC transporter permease [Candidatus Hydrogenedentota bacterium]HRT63506.1 ABC transporter permease [Candidatus Hydrogenedentota bacterium]
MTSEIKTRAGIRRQIRLPNREAFKIALRSVRIRLWRSCITMAGIVLTIAFLSSVLTSNIAAQALQPSGAQTIMETTGNRATQVWLAAISLLVCVVGITNAMLMSVTERYREIGTMKCLGALDWFVVKLFLIEAGVIGLLGSLLGAALGFMFSLLAWMAQYEHVFSAMPWRAVFARLAMAVVVGAVLSVIGAIYPARRAGKMPPADAMRTEV